MKSFKDFLLLLWQIVRLPIQVILILAIYLLIIIGFLFGLKLEVQHNKN